MGTGFDNPTEVPVSRSFHRKAGPIPFPSDHWEGEPHPLQNKRQHISDDHHVSAIPVLGGFYHEYKLEKIGA